MAGFSGECIMKMKYKLKFYPSRASTLSKFYPNPLKNLHMPRNITTVQTRTHISITVRPALKNFLFPITHIAKKKSPGQLVRLFFFTLFKLNITFYFKCHSHHNCSVNLNWINTQLYSSSKPLRNVPSSVFWFVNFCFLPFLRRTGIQKWKKNFVMYTSE